VVRFLFSVTEPVLVPVRRRLPVTAAGFDFSPIVVWIAAVFVQRFLVHTLYDLAMTLK
jgi:YggT family protein